MPLVLRVRPLEAFLHVLPSVPHVHGNAPNNMMHPASGLRKNSRAYSTPLWVVTSCSSVSLISRV